MIGKCPSCKKTQDLGERIFGKLGGLLAGSLLGGGASKHPLGVALGIIGGVGLGHLIDTRLLPNCPSCGVALELIDEAIPV